jgi:tetratricopeptide (TPR) repeat protein
MPHRDKITFAAFSPDGTLVLTGSYDQTARFWSAIDGAPVGPPMPSYGPVSVAAFRPDGKAALLGSNLKIMRRYQVTGQLYHVPSPVAGDPRRIELWVQVITGTELDENNVVHSLDARTWHDRRRLLAALGGPPIPAARPHDPSIDWHRRAAAESEGAGQWFAARWHLDRLIAAVPGDGSLFARRGRALAVLGRRDEAAADYAVAIEHGADAWSWWALALLRVSLGDAPGYRAVCARMLDRFGALDEPRTADIVAEACNLAPDSVTDPMRVVALAERAVASDPKNRHFLNTLGASLYRAGRFQEAVRRLDEARAMSADEEGSIWDWLPLAMAHHRLGHADEARRWLSKAVGWIEHEVPKSPEAATGGAGLSWNQRLVILVVRREAEMLIREGRPVFLPANVFRDHPAPSPPIRPPGR